MKLVKSVFRHPSGEHVYDPAERLVKEFNRSMENLAALGSPRLAELIDHLAEQIVEVRLHQDNTIVEGAETKALYHERRRGDSGIVREHGR